MDDILISAKNIIYKYKENDKPVLNGIDIDIKRGEFVAVIGPNGSGKSTLTKMFNAMLIPTCGVVSVCGIETSDEDKIFDIRRQVGMVMQNPDNQLVATIVEEDVAFGPENLGIEPKEIRHRVDEALKTVGMYEYRTHAPHKLSGGQKQRIAIAGVIAMEPDCIIYDEPTAMLDPLGRREVLSTILKLKKEKNIGAVLITHFMEEASLAERVIVIDKGKILADGKPWEIFSKVDFLREHKLDAPAAAVIAASLKKEGILNISSHILNTNDFADALYSAWRQRNANN